MLSSWCIVADYDRDYGPDTPMSEGGKAMIVSVLGHAPCVCDSLRKHGVDGMCSRCKALDYCKKHWPWWYFTTIGNMGAENVA